MKFSASTADVVNVPNVWHLAHLSHQTQKRRFIRCSKSQKLCNMTTVPSQILDGTNRNGINFYSFLFSFLSPLSSLYSLFSLLPHNVLDLFLSHSLSTSPLFFFHSFFAHSRCFSLFLSALLRHLLNLISIFFYFFFFFRDLMGRFGNGWV